MQYKDTQLKTSSLSLKQTNKTLFWAYLALWLISFLRHFLTSVRMKSECGRYCRWPNCFFLIWCQALTNLQYFYPHLHIFQVCQTKNWVKIWKVEINFSHSIWAQLKCWSWNSASRICMQFTTIMPFILFSWSWVISCKIRWLFTYREFNCTTTYISPSHILFY